MNRNLIVLAIIVFIDHAGIGLIVPVMPSLIEGLTGEGVDRAAEIGGWLLFAYAVMQFLFAPIIGGLSDRFGRRPVLIATLALLGVDYALMAWAPTLTWLFVGRIISGIMGASWAAANSCIADSIPRERRGAAFGMLGGAGAAGFVLGPAIGGLIGQFGDRLPFVAAAIMCAAGTVYGLLYFKETLPAERRRSFDPFRSNPFGSLQRLSRIPLVAGCLLTIFLMQLASQSQLSVWAYYGSFKFGWTPLVIGGTVALFGALLVVTQGILSGKSIARYGPVRTATVSLAFAIPSFLILAFAPNTPAVILGIVVGAVPGMCFPAMQQLMSARIDEDAQGELQGAIASTISLTAILGPPVMTGVFGAYADGKGLVFPGAPFLLAALLMVAAVAVLTATLRRHQTG
ncbi:MFS transporter [Qipengyuania marisflavi]|uniref:TCR/Tet family MFS transporter n=1 Tax=Qipengyuania marisflavi TaxID=2486356 RepID=A0A5S3P187_9SPHN|nr:MFS transporter [Qipengyuania marisflavi]TMM46670.1 TCR/Tet family MFS transporter [Qipengyuania marisflavi]